MARYGMVRRKLDGRSVVKLVLVEMAFLVSLAFAKEIDLGRVVYQVALFTLCATPYFLLSHLPRFRLLIFFLLVYYALFGMLDYVLLFTDPIAELFVSLARIPRTALADWVILAGAIAIIASYMLVVALWHRSPARLRSAWRYRPAVLFAFACWGVGIVAQFIVQFLYEAQGGPEVGLVSHLVSNLFYLAILGDIIMVVTAQNHSHTKLAWFFLAIMIGVEFIFGLLGNTKEVSFRLIALILITTFFMCGRIRLPMIALFLLIFIPYQVVFNIYRVQVLQVRDKSALEAIKSMDSTVATVKKEQAREKDAQLKSLFIFLDRVDGRKYVEIITQHTGKDAPFLRGYTLGLYFYSFVPKMLWPDKPQISVGQLMNHTFGLSASPKTYVPATQLGELYWNFGMPGVLFGMAFVGGFLALVSAMIMSGNRVSTVGMLIIMVTTYFLIIRFEDGFATQYNHFTRVSIMIGLMALLFRRLGWAVRHPSVGVNREPVSSAAGRQSAATSSAASADVPLPGARRTG